MKLKKNLELLILQKVIVVNNLIINKINIGHIMDIHFEILNIVNELEFVTSRQLCQLLEYRGVDYKSQDKLNNKLDQMVKSKILTRYYFSSEEGKGIFKVYCMEKRRIFTKVFQKLYIN